MCVGFISFEVRVKIGNLYIVYGNICRTGFGVINQLLFKRDFERLYRNDFEKGREGATEQIRAWPHSALTYDPTISVEGNRFLLTGFQPWGGGCLRALLLRALLSCENHCFPCSPKGYKPKPWPEVPHICPSASHANRSPSPLEGALVGFRVTILSQQLSPSGCGVCCSQPPCSGSGKHVLCYTGS